MNQQNHNNNSESLQKAQSYSLRIIAIRPRTEKEIRTKLKEKGFDENIIETLVKKLISTNLINDKNFATLWIESRKNFRHKSSFVIKRELIEKGVDEEIIDKLLTDGPSDLESATELLRKKSHLFHKKVGRDKILKMQQFLARNGFSWDVINKVTKKEE